MKQFFSFSKALLILSVVLVVMNIALVFQNYGLRSQLESRKPASLQRNDKLRPLKMFDIDNNEVSLDFSESEKTVLLFFNTKCKFCEQQMPFWRKLASLASERGYQFVALTSESDMTKVDLYLREHGIVTWKVGRITFGQANQAKLVGTPVTAVIDQKGTVERGWTGLWQAADVDDAENYFDTNFHEVQGAP